MQHSLNYFFFNTIWSSVYLYKSLSSLFNKWPALYSIWAILSPILDVRTMLLLTYIWYTHLQTMKWRYGSCDWSAALGCGLWSKKFQSCSTVANLSNPPWWKCRILYWLSLDATTSCPHVHALSLKNSRSDLIWPASILSFCNTTVFHYVMLFFSAKFYILGKLSCFVMSLYMFIYTINF